MAEKKQDTAPALEPPKRERFTVIPREGGSVTIGAESNEPNMKEPKDAEASDGTAGQD